MKRSRWAGVLPWLLLFGAALVFGLAAGGQPGADSPLPSTHNPGPRGAAVLHTWLSEGGGAVERLDGPLTAIPAGVEVLVLAAPTDREVTRDEVDAVERFVEAGGTLLYFSPRPATAQPELAKWLALKDTVTTLPRAEETTLGDLGGATVQVDVPRGLLAGARQLRVSADTGLEVEDAAIPVAQKMLWWRGLGKGEVWIAAGADLLENRRLQLLDNPQLWANLARRRVAFDEFHFAAAPKVAWSANLWATLGQFFFVSLIFVAARGRRLGPGRPTPIRQQRSILEYVGSMGALLRRAGVEGPLAVQQRDRLRRLMHERLGIGLQLPSDEASRLLASHTGLPPGAWSRFEASTLGPVDFAAHGAEAARLEAAVVGRRAG